MKTKRPKVFVSQIVNQLQKYDRRIQQMAEHAYKLRQMLEAILKENQADAIRGNAESEGLGSTPDNAEPSGGLVRPGLQADGGKVEGEPKLDDVEPHTA